MVIKDILNKAYEAISENDTNKNYEACFSIIQIKKENIELLNHQQSIYLDIKHFIDNYIISASFRDFGYDNLDLNKIYFAINSENSIEAKYELINHTTRKLKLYYYDDLAEEIKLKKLKLKLELILKKKRITKYFEALLILTSFNLLSIFISLFILLLVILALMQNAFIEKFELYEFTYESFSKNDLLNQLLNVMAKPIGLAENFKIKSLNEISIILLILLKSLYLLIVSNYLYVKIKENFIK